MCCGEEGKSAKLKFLFKRLFTEHQKVLRGTHSSDLHCFYRWGTGTQGHDEFFPGSIRNPRQDGWSPSPLPVSFPVTLPSGLVPPSCRFSLHSLPKPWRKIICVWQEGSSLNDGDENMNKVYSMFVCLLMELVCTPCENCKIHHDRKKKGVPLNSTILRYCYHVTIFPSSLLLQLAYKLFTIDYMILFLVFCLILYDRQFVVSPKIFLSINFSNNTVFH